MELPELLRKQAEKLLFTFCQQAAEDVKLPRHVRYRVEGQQINLFEVRRNMHNPREHQQLPMAQIRYTPELNQWTLHYKQESHWQFYLNAAPTLDLSKLLLAIRQDPMGYFWQK